jgi:NAD(P)-dependent dehydrogenase (short-subunit alcohol dehydrogenase family)
MSGPGEPAAPRVAVVTGGGSGIGLAVSERLAADGMPVAVFDRDADAAQVTAGKIQASGGRALGLAVDVTEREQIVAGVARVREHYGPPTILVNNAGLHAVDPFLKISPEKWQRLLDVNLTGTFNCCQAAVPGMIEQGWGRIVNISSSSAHSGQQYMTHYVAAKAGVIGFTKSLALELGPKGITVNTIPPGFIDTPMLRRQESKGLLGEGVEHHAALTPVRRIGRPEDIAALCSFLVRDEASYITGQVLGVNGGRNT